MTGFWPADAPLTYWVLAAQAVGVAVAGLGVRLRLRLLVTWGAVIVTAALALGLAGILAGGTFWWGRG